MTEARRIDVGDAELEVFIGGAEDPDAPLVAAAHPASAYERVTIDLLATTVGARIVCVNPRGIGGSSPIPDDRPCALADIERRPEVAASTRAFVAERWAQR